MRSVNDLKYGGDAVRIAASLRVDAELLELAIAQMEQSLHTPSSPSKILPDGRSKVAADLEAALYIQKENMDELIQSLKAAESDERVASVCEEIGIMQESLNNRLKFLEERLAILHRRDSLPPSPQAAHQSCRLDPLAASRTSLSPLSESLTMSQLSTNRTDSRPRESSKSFLGGDKVKAAAVEWLAVLRSNMQKTGGVPPSSAASQIVESQMSAPAPVSSAAYQPRETHAPFFSSSSVPVVSSSPASTRDSSFSDEYDYPQSTPLPQRQQQQQQQRVSPTPIKRSESIIVYSELPQRTPSWPPPIAPPLQTAHPSTLNSSMDAFLKSVQRPSQKKRATAAPAEKGSQAFSTSLPLSPLKGNAKLDRASPVTGWSRMTEKRFSGLPRKSSEQNLALNSEAAFSAVQKKPQSTVFGKEKRETFIGGTIPKLERVLFPQDNK